MAFQAFSLYFKSGSDSKYTQGSSRSIKLWAILRGLRNSTEVKAFVLHASNPLLIPGTSCGPLNTVRGSLQNREPGIALEHF